MRNLIYITIGIVLIANNSFAQNRLGEILDDEIASGADLIALEQEARSLNTIKKGIALSLAMCEGIELCTPNVNRDELEQFINTINTRIDSLSQRMGESDNTEIEPVLIAYADARESYSEYLDKLGTMVVEEDTTDDLFGQDDFFSTIRQQRPTKTLRQFQELFNDVDEEILDDIIIEEDAIESISEESTE